MARVTVVGGGVVGLTSALQLARAGHEVQCVRDQPVSDTVSAVAGGLWFPYHVEPRDRVNAWGAVALARFAELVGDPASGVVLREGLVVERGAADRWWTQGLPSWREAGAAEVPAGASGGVVATAPLVTMPVFLPWLENRCAEAGVALQEAHVESLEQLDAEVVVVAAGLRSGALVDGGSGMPSRGQVALLANPGLTRWLVDDDHPDGMLYVLPHPGWVVCGGTDVSGSWDTEPDPAVHEAIVARARTAVPELAHADVLGARVGLRPVAAAVSLTASEVGDRLIVTNHGHGGAGVTLSWGCAEEVVRLVAGDPPINPT
ncbi:MAG TPA: FAD-dependent oxidoreductase [Ornithinibacter sp.]|nr:FAD-dependent oxidoreductase [Ornithinibacter sp.]